MTHEAYSKISEIEAEKISTEIGTRSATEIFKQDNPDCQKRKDDIKDTFFPLYPCWQVVSVHFFSTLIISESLYIR